MTKTILNHDGNIVVYLLAGHMDKTFLLLGSQCGFKRIFQTIAQDDTQSCPVYNHPTAAAWVSRHLPPRYSFLHSLSHFLHGQLEALNRLPSARVPEVARDGQEYVHHIVDKIIQAEISRRVTQNLHHKEVAYIVIQHVNWEASKGIVVGTTEATFAPDQNVTRQEMAIDRSAAQGLDTKDSGSAIMYENGKMVKSACSFACKWTDKNLYCEKE